MCIRDRIHHDRERVEEKESDADLSATDPAILESADNANEHAAPTRESTQYAARYEPGSGTVNVHAKQTATDRRSTVDAPSGDSLTEAKSITAKFLGDSAKTLAAQTESGSYRGPIIGETEHHIIPVSYTHLSYSRRDIRVYEEYGRVLAVSSPWERLLSGRGLALLPAPGIRGQRLWSRSN